jgi:M6 family metalloprotease-like protein
MFKETILNYVNRSSRAFPTTGTNNLLMILANFNDTSTTYLQSDFNNYMNQVNYNGTGSFKDYYLECSYGQLILNTTVTSWVTVPNTHDYYGPQANWGEFAYNSVQAADASVDYSNYDNDSDGTVDGVAIIHQGPGQEATSNINDIWSHSWNLSSAGYSIAERTFDGVLVNAYTTQPETGSGGMATIGVMCHEFGHNLGAPDYYDTDGTGSGGSYVGMGYWCVMASGSYNGSNGTKPAHHNAFTKWYYYGWCTPALLTSGTDVSMGNSVTSSTDFYYYTTTTSNEYFFLENRQQTGFDIGVPGHGLIILHVDQDYIDLHDNTNDINAGSHQGLYPKAANGTINDASCPFPGTTSNTSFTDTTTPNSQSWASANTNKPITNIQEIGGVISFDFMGGNLAIPDVTVNPTSYSENLGLNATEQRTLSITNDGESGSILNYDVIIASTREREITELPKSNNPTVDIPIAQITTLPVKHKLPPNNTDATIITHQTGPYYVLNFGVAGVYICAARFDSTELSSFYTGNDITQVRIYLYTNDFTNCTIKVWEGGSLGNPGTEVYSQDITGSVTINGWTTHTLTSPVNLIAGNEYWVGYSLAHTGLGDTFTTDIGPMVTNKGAWLKIDSGSWGLFGNDLNWCIEMVVDVSSTVLTVTSPNGGEEWANGSSHNITWNHSGTALTNVKLELSTNNGAGYSDIIASTLNDGTYEWTVSGTASEECLVRVSDPAVPTTNDVSNAVFSIYDTVTWLSIDQDNGSLGQSSTDNLTLTFDTSGLTAGTYNANIEISSNDPDEAIVTIPVTLTVNDNSSSGSGNNSGNTSGPAVVDMPITNIDGNSVDPDVSITPAGSVGISVDVTVTDEVQSGTPVPYPDNVIISYAVDVIGTISDVNLEFDLEFTGLSDLDQIHWLNGTNWEVPSGVSWTPTNHVTFNLTLTDRDASTEIILSGDNPLPVTLSSFTAAYIGGTPIISWVTQSETENIGWNVYRSYSQNFGQAQILNLQTIPGNGTTSQPSFYSFTDEYEVYEGFTYWYWLESICGDGETESFGPI